jgi:hypothetical protein
MLKKFVVLVIFGLTIAVGGMAVMTFCPDQAAADGNSCSGC